MSTNLVTLLHDAMFYLEQIPVGIDPEGVDETDMSPADMTHHVASIAARRVLEAVRILEEQPCPTT